MLAPGHGILARTALIPPPCSKCLRSKGRNFREEANQTKLTQDAVEKLPDVRAPRTPFSPRRNGNVHNTPIRRGRQRRRRQSSVSSQGSAQSSLTDSSPSLRGRNGNRDAVDRIARQQSVFSDDDWPYSKTAMTSLSGSRPPFTPAPNNEGGDTSLIKPWQAPFPSSPLPETNFPMPTPLPPLPLFLTTQDVDELLRVSDEIENGEFRQNGLEAHSGPSSDSADGRNPDRCIHCPVHCPYEPESSSFGSPTPMGSSTLGYSTDLSGSTIDVGAQGTAPHGLAMARAPNYRGPQPRPTGQNPFGRLPPRRWARTHALQKYTRKQLESFASLGRGRAQAGAMLVNEKVATVKFFEGVVATARYYAGLAAAGLPQPGWELSGSRLAMATTLSATLPAM